MITIAKGHALPLTAFMLTILIVAPLYWKEIRGQADIMKLALMAGSTTAITGVMDMATGIMAIALMEEATAMEIMEEVAVAQQLHRNNLQNSKDSRTSRIKAMQERKF
jgi:hypothetical protein